MRITIIHGSIEATHKWFKPLLDRVAEFSQTFGDGEEDISSGLVLAVSQSFMSKSPSMLAWIGIDENEKIVAHLLATVDAYFGHKYVMVHQLWVDKGVEFTDQDRATFYRALARWGADNGCREVHCMANNAAVAKIFKARDGFEETGRVSMKRIIQASDLPPVEENR